MKTTTPTPPAHCTFDPEDWLRLARCWHPVARACDIAGAPVPPCWTNSWLSIVLKARWWSPATSARTAGCR